MLFSENCQQLQTPPDHRGNGLAMPMLAQQPVYRFAGKQDSENHRRAARDKSLGIVNIIYQAGDRHANGRFLQQVSASQRSRRSRRQYDKPLCGETERQVITDPSRSRSFDAILAVTTVKNQLRCHPALRGSAITTSRCWQNSQGQTTEGV